MQMRPLAKALFLSVTAFATAADAQVTSYGSGVNPPGSLVVLGGVPTLGTSFTVGVSNTATSSAPSSLAFLSIASEPDPAFPAGTVLPGFGLSAPGAPGELLLHASASLFRTIGPVPWTGGTTPPASFSLSLPLAPALAGLTLYLQGCLLDLASEPFLGVTNGLAVTLSAPEFPGLVLIQPGTFVMGSNAPTGAPYYNVVALQPAHPVTISKPYWMGRHEVTQAEYQALMGTNPSTWVGAERPVEHVSWVNAVAYCEALNAQQSALGKVPLGYQYRLPTEAEWEYACRAGSTTEFHYGPSLLCDQAMFDYSLHSSPIASCDNSPGTVPVGSYAPNAWGLHDMHGNVWEWCLDSFEFYTPGAKTDPFETGGLYMLLRGGSWGFHSYHCRSAYRIHSFPWSSYDNTGFRVVLGPVLVP